MAGHRLTDAVTSPVDAYLRELTALLHGPRRRRAQILTELGDGLRQSVDDRIAEGVPPAVAEREAIAGFGTPGEVADAFNPELTTAYARRTIATYVATGPLIGIWWLLLLRPHAGHTDLTALLVAIPVLPLVSVAIVTAMTTLATTGRLIRWLPEAGPRRATAAVLAIAGLVLAADTALIAMYLHADTPWRPLAVVAVAASATRIAYGVTTLRRAAGSRHVRAGDIDGLG